MLKQKPLKLINFVESYVLCFAAIATLPFANAGCQLSAAAGTLRRNIPSFTYSGYRELATFHHLIHLTQDCSSFFFSFFFPQEAQIQMSQPADRSASSQAAGSVLAQLMLSEEYSDLSFSCRGEMFQVHKAIVCPQSSVIQAAVKSGFKASIPANFCVSAADRFARSLRIAC